MFLKFQLLSGDLHIPGDTLLINADHIVKVTHSRITRSSTHEYTARVYLTDGQTIDVAATLNEIIAEIKADSS